MKIALPTDHYIRFFFILLFIVTVSPLTTILILISIIQPIAKYFTGMPVDSLTLITQHTLSYLIQMIEYITYLSTSAPFPLNAWKNHYE